VLDAFFPLPSPLSPRPSPLWSPSGATPVHLRNTLHHLRARGLRLHRGVGCRKMEYAGDSTHRASDRGNRLVKNRGTAIA
jgi:hypothetical protein